jgi:glycosyltransferase involved in cell wall biosynthesis
MVKVLLVSTHTSQNTGYAKVSKYLIRTLKQHFKVVHFGFQRNPEIKTVEDCPTYSIDSTEKDSFGFKSLQACVDMSDPDIIIIYNDPMIIAEFLKHLTTTAKIIPYMDIVYSGVNESMLKYINERVHSYLTLNARVATMLSPFKKPTTVVPHGVDKSVFVKLDIPKPVKTFINVNRNSQRKRLDLTIQGFVQYLKKDPTAVLILVTDSRGYYDIPMMYTTECRIHKVDGSKNLLFRDTSKPLTDVQINELYNMASTNINTSNGEGVGLSVLETSHLGLNQVVTNVGDYAFTEATKIPMPFYEYSNSPLGMLVPNTVSELVVKALSESVEPKPQPTWDEALIPLINHLKAVNLTEAP